MTTYDAGAIRATAELHRDPFIEGLLQCQKAGDEFARKSFTATANVDTLKARRAIADLDLLIQAVNKEKITTKATADTAAATAGIAKLRAEQDALNKGGDGASRTRARAYEQETKSVSLLGVAVASLVPMIGPLAGFAAAGAAGLGAMGITGLVAVKGIGAEMKAGTQQGQQYKSMVTGIKAEWASLETTVATNVRAGVSGTFQELIAAGPQLNAEFAGVARQTGDIAQHGVGAIIAAMHTLNPLITQFLGDVDRGAVNLEKWAQGGGLQKFVTWAQANLPAIERDLGEVGKAIVQILSAGAGEGMFLLNTLGTLARDVGWLAQHVPGSVAVLTDLYLAMQLFKGLGTATKALEKFAAAEVAANTAAKGGAAESGLLGGAAAFTGRLLPAAAALVAVGVGISQADAATKGWANSTNQAAQFAHGYLDILHDMATFHWTDIWSTGKSDADNAQRVLGLSRSYAGALQDIAAGQAAVARGPANIRYTAPTGNPAGVSAQPKIITAGTPLAGSIDSVAYLDSLAAHNKAWAQSLDPVSKAYIMVNQQLRSTAISDASEKYAGLQAVIQKNVDVTDAFTKLGGRTEETYRGVAISQGTYAAALQMTNNDANAAVGMIHGQVDAMLHERDTINDLIVRQGRLADYQTDLTTKYGLTSQQVDLYSAALGLNADKITASNAAEADAEKQIGAVYQTLSNSTTAIQGWTQAVASFTKGEDTAATRGALIGEALRAANGDMLSFANTMVTTATANQQLVTDFRSLNKGVLDLKTGTLDYHNAAAAPVLGDLQQLQTAAMNSAAAIYQHETALGNANAADDAFATYVNDTQGALVNQARQIGLTVPQAKALADQYLGIKNAGDLKKQIELIGQDKVVDALTGILKDLDIVAGTHNAEVYLNGHIDPAAQKIIGYVGSPVSTTYTISGGPRGLGYTATGAIYYAGGGIEDHRANIYRAAPPGMVRAFAEPETLGEAYIPLANDGRRPRAQTIVKETARRLGGVAMFESGGFSGVNYTSGGGAGTFGGGGGGGSYKFAGHTYSSLTAMRNAEVSAFGSLANNVSKDISNLGQGAKMSAAQIGSAMAHIVDSVKRANQLGKEPNSFIATLGKENMALQQAAAMRQKYATDFAKANAAVIQDQQNMAAETARVHDTIVGGFDIGQSGQGYSSGIMSTLDRQLSDAQKFQQLLTQAQSMGLDPKLIQQLAEEGPQTAGKNLQAIVSQGAGYISQLNAKYAQLGTVATAVGGQAAQAEYGQQLATDMSAMLKANNAVAAYNKLISQDMTTIKGQLQQLENTLVASRRQAGG